MLRNRSGLSRLVCGVAAAVLATVAGLGLAVAEASGGDGRRALDGYGRATWASFVAMTDAESGLPADSLAADGSTSVQTSPTNIGAYLWSTLGAERVGIIDHDATVDRLAHSLHSLETMERHEPSGQYYNWYDHHTGAKLTTWPPTGAPLTPILSSVDNGWLAVGLRLVAREVPELADRAAALYDSMDFGFYYRPEVNRVLFHYVPDTGESVCCYDTLVSESRIVDYVGIAKGEIPPRAYFGRWRSFPDTCDWSWQETRPFGMWRTYLGVDVF
jgi:hypothetical protein